MEIIKRLILEEEGQGMAEYALILVFIAIACIAGYRAFGQALDARVNDIGSKI